MNYEKAYKEALERAKKALEVFGTDKCEGARQIFSLFPELKESEDEKVRKDIIWSLKHSGISSDRPINPHVNTIMKDAIAWLEKQGEKKSIDDLTQQEAMDIAVGKCFEQSEQKSDKGEPKFKVKYAGSEYNVLEVKDIAGVTYYGIEDEPNHIDYVQAENCERVGGYSIKENGSPYPTKPAMFSEQKPAWSEEDELIRKALINLVEMYYGNWLDKSEKNRLLDFLKSLKERIGG